ncbi:MAG: NmrA family NAD(P)-binding protein [Candidatus Obscuribacterales bacterium]|nr:NmrA family NAD(P)-binding protein [Candidatus Obscuribacterales bacterium]
MNTSKILVTAATGSTGREITRLLIEKGHSVSALVHQMDNRSDALAKLGADVKVGDLLDLNAVSAALSGIDGAYFCYPIKPGLLQATAYFAQAAREAGVKAIVNMSQISARRDSKSHAAQDHWTAERVFDWSGISVTHVRPTFFAEWLLYVAPVIGSGVMRMPLFADAQHAPVAAEDQARVIAAILDSPEGHAGKIYPLYGAKDLDQNEIAAIVGKALDVPLKYEQVPASVFVADGRGGGEKSLSPDAQFLIQHLEQVAIDHRNGIFAGTNDVIQTIGKAEPMDVEQFVLKHKSAFGVTTKSVAV